MRSVIPWRITRVLAVFAVLTIPCFAAQIAVLKNGFTIQHERRQIIGDVTRLFVSADGASYVDVPTENIDHYEQAPDPVASAPPAFSRTGRMSSSLGFPARPHADLNQVVNEASGRYQLDPDLVNSVIKAESGFNSHAVSPKGAQGLMQLMPGTASQLGVPNAFDPQANVEGGTKYLRELLERYNFDLLKALAAYNAGPQRVEQFGGIPPYYETRAYVARVVRDFNRKKTAQKKAGATLVSKSRPAAVSESPSRPTASRDTASKPKTSTVKTSARTSRSLTPRVQASANSPASN